MKTFNVTCDEKMLVWERRSAEVEAESLEEAQKRLFEKDDELDITYEFLVEGAEPIGETDFPEIYNTEVK